MKADHQTVVQAFRGGMVESTYRGSAVVVDSSGRIVAGVGNPYVLTPMRSTAKPFQAVALLEHPDVQDLELKAQEIAVVVGSHNGEDAHVSVIQEVARKCHLSVDDLKCGVHPPLVFSLATEAMLRGEWRLSSLQHNCSGNHFGMLMLAKLMNETTEGYQQPDHPVQQVITRTITEIFEIDPSTLALATDGCGVPTYGMRLDRIAAGYARLAVADGSRNHDQALANIRDAMMTEPYFVAGTGRLETDLMKCCPVIAKLGAQGVYAIGIPEQGLGIAIKLEAGPSEAVECFAVELLSTLGILSPIADRDLAWYRFRNMRSPDGTAVAHYQPVGVALQGGDCFLANA